jgi:hypothetical protein
MPVHYTLDYGAPLVATMGFKGRSIAVASARGLCVLECSPFAKKIKRKERSYLFPDTETNGKTHSKATAGPRLPPKWYLFGNEIEEKAFQVIAMTWWEGDEKRRQNHLNDDLIVAVIQLQKQAEKTSNPTGRFYLACWSHRR